MSYTVRGDCNSPQEIDCADMRAAAEIYASRHLTSHDDECHIYVKDADGNIGTFVAGVLNVSVEWDIIHLSGYGDEAGRRNAEEEDRLLKEWNEINATGGR